MIWAWHPSLVVDHPLFLEQPSYALQESKASVVEHHRLVKVARNSNGGGKFLIVECQQLWGALRLE
jgi:hypothetical protein